MSWGEYLSCMGAASVLKGGEAVPPGRRAAGRPASVQAEHVEHVEHARAVPRQKAHRAQAALRVGGAAGRFVRDLDALADTSKQHHMLAHEVAAANGGKTDARRIALGPDAFAGVDGAFLQVAPQRLRYHLA